MSEGHVLPLRFFDTQTLISQTA